MRKKELAKEVIERLKKEYPDAGCSLEYDQAWKLLVSVRLAAQCTDARVNIVVEKLYEKFPDVKALAEAPVEEIKEIVRPVSYTHLGNAYDCECVGGRCDVFYFCFLRYIRVRRCEIALGCTAKIKWFL